MIVYRHDQIPNRIEYKYLKSTLRERYGDYNHNAGGTYHLGQLKLFMSELMFLSKMITTGTETVVYAGAAPGHHISILASLFPNSKFELWDPRQFKLKMLDNIKTNVGFFTNEVADSYAERREKGEDILFISDIRDKKVVSVAKTLSTDETKGMDADEQLISTDMALQKEWCDRIKPRAALLKFRFPWKPGMTTYYDGKIYLQPYYSIATESRLLVTDFDNLIDYDHDEYNDKIYFFHANIRFDPIEDERWKKVLSNNSLKISWDNYIGFYTVAHYLEKKNNKSASDQEVFDLFDKIVTEHRKLFGSKYDYVFAD
jgi:Poly A polymerase regulatory subunit